MKIKRKSIVFHNLLSAKGVFEQDKWYDLAVALRNVIISRGLYTNAPLIYRCTKIDEDNYEYTLYMPINAEVKLEEDHPFSFIKELNIKDAFVHRLCEVNKTTEAEAHLFLSAAAYSQKCVLETPFYNICLNVFGDTMLDIVAPVAGELVESDDEKAEG